MSDLQARVINSPRAFHVEGYEKIEYDLVYVDGVFAPDSLELAETYRPYGRALMVVDETVYDLYGNEIHAVFRLPRHRTHRDAGANPGDREVAGDLRANRRDVQRLSDWCAPSPFWSSAAD